MDTHTPPDNPELQPGSSASPAPSARPRIPYACEACRAAKVKCQPSSANSICGRCAASKRECVFKTGPRTRRRRSKLHPAASRKTPPPSAPSKTFTIDVPISAEYYLGVDSSDALDILRGRHEKALTTLVPGDDPDVLSLAQPPPLSSTSGSSRPLSAPTPPSSTTGSQSSHSVRPQFNLDSATALLASFRADMLPRYPVTSLPAVSADGEVPALARARPFVLLAVLAAASTSRSLQGGHGLYDEEFRRVLGLKFVSGGERSMELLVGLLIYCAWYPFHLRPKNKQALQYVRMASDIVKDLELDQAPEDLDVSKVRSSEHQMAGVRAYLACQYLCSSFSSTWKTSNTLPYQQWTTTCCNILLGSQDVQATEADQTLVWLVRLGHIVEETLSLTKQRGQMHSEDQHELFMEKGLEAQFQEWQTQVPVEHPSQPVRRANIFTKIILLGYPLLGFIYGNNQKNRRRPPSSPAVVTCAADAADPDRLLSCAHALRLWYEQTASLPATDFAHHTAIEWAYFVIAIILGLRLSFPMPPAPPPSPLLAAPHDSSSTPTWDHAAARGILGLGAFLETFSDDTEDAGVHGRERGARDVFPFTSVARRGGGADVLSASRVVVGVVRRKYEGRIAAMERTELAAAAAAPHPMAPQDAGMDRDRNLHKCPMLDGSLDGYLKAWEDVFPSAAMGSAASATEFVTSSGAVGVGSWVGMKPPGTQPVVFHDLWATMTMGWARDGLEDVDFGGI